MYEIKKQRITFLTIHKGCKKIYKYLNKTVNESIKSDKLNIITNLI